MSSPREIHPLPPPLLLLLVILLSVGIPGGFTCAWADENAAEPPVPPGQASALRKTLREFDRFLDHHVVLEDQLRINPALISDQVFLHQHIILRNFLLENPNVSEGLERYPRYFLNRALMRQASAPVSFVDLAPFKDLFMKQPMLERDLEANPELIRDPAYEKSHPALRDCFLQHPVLARVFLPASVQPQSK